MAVVVAEDEVLYAGQVDDAERVSNVAESLDDVFGADALANAAQ